MSLIDIHVEIGTPEQQEAIRAELQWMFTLLGEEFLNYIELHQVIIPLDFDETVNRLQNTTSYTSDRIQICIAKIIEAEGSNYVILSQLAYYELMDFGKRCRLIFHELYHLSNIKLFHIPEPVNTSESRYTNTIAIMYDEYTANLFANDLILKLENHDIFGDVKAGLVKDYSSFLSSILDENQYYLPIKNEYQDWRKHGDTLKMLNNTIQYIDAAIKDITYCYSFADAYDSLKKDFQKQSSVFLNEDTENLFNLFRGWHSTPDLEIDFESGLDAVRRFMATCFGIVFGNAPLGERFDLVPF
jgi:hypothetical protein